MPQYKNSTAAPITIGSLRIGAHDTITTTQILRTLPTGITLVSANPQNGVNIAVSAQYTGDIVDAAFEIAIPAGYKWQVVIACTAGAATVYLNNTTTELIRIPVGKVVKLFVDAEYIEKLTFDYTSNSSVIEVDIYEGGQLDIEWFK